MILGLSVASPESFARRAIVPKPKGIAALVVPADEIEQVTADVLTTLTNLSCRVAEVKLDSALREWPAASAPGSQARAVLVATTSEDEDLWRAFDGHRSRVEKAGTTLFVLSERAATTLQHSAPHLMSLIGTMWATEPRGDRRLVSAVDAARAARYPELYEAVDARAIRDFDAATSDVLAALGDPSIDDRAWRRLGVMGHAALVEVMPTIAAHWPPGLASANAVRSALDTWLSGASSPAAVDSLPAAPLAPQALGEAMGVVDSAAHLLDRREARAALSEILDSIFQGYAVFPGSEGRRALFDWWLDEVVPAAAALRAPIRFNRRVKSGSPSR